MKLAHSVRLAAWFLIGLNLLMAFSSIWIFVRMAPAIELIIDRNVTSLQTCEEMLAALAAIKNNQSDRQTVAATPAQITFNKALSRARQNITEQDEPQIIESIEVNSAKAFRGDLTAERRTIESILNLGAVNRAAMVAADKKARQIGNAGAWGIVFMASLLFLVGMVFMRRLKKNLVHPLEEIHQVTAAFRHGDTMRRCTGTALPREILQIYSELNDVLDRTGQKNYPQPKQEQLPAA